MLLSFAATFSRYLVGNDHPNACTVARLTLYLKFAATHNFEPLYRICHTDMIPILIIFLYLCPGIKAHTVIDHLNYMLIALLLCSHSQGSVVHLTVIESVMKRVFN